MPSVSTDGFPVQGEIKEINGLKYLVAPAGQSVFHGSRNSDCKLESWNNYKYQRELLWFSSCDVPRFYLGAKDGCLVFEFKTCKELNLVILDDKETNVKLLELSTDEEYKDYLTLAFDPENRISSLQDLTATKLLLGTLTREAGSVEWHGYVAGNWKCAHKPYCLFHLELAVLNWTDKLKPVRSYKYANDIDVTNYTASLEACETVDPEEYPLEDIKCNFKYRPPPEAEAEAETAARGGGGTRTAAYRVAIPLVALAGALAALVPRRRVT